MRIKSLQSEIEAALAQAKRIQVDIPKETVDYAILSSVISHLEKALNSFNPKPKGSVETKRKP